MFNVGDRVVCISGGYKGMSGVVTGFGTPFRGEPRLLVDLGGIPVNLWEHRFIHEPTPQEKIVSKIKQMEQRQKWRPQQL